MNTYTRNWSVFTTHQRKKKIDPKPQYQRGPVWNQAKQQLLIDTMLRQYDMPKFYLRKLPKGSKYEHEVIDGQQRLLAVWGFMADEFPIALDTDPFPEFGDLSGKYYSQLPGDVLDRFGMYELTVVEVIDATEDEIRDLFLRLQEGVSLNPAEKRNAMLGNMRDFIYNLAETHRVFPLTSILSKRFAWHDLAAHVACLELAGGPTDLKAANLKKFYEDNEKFDPKSSQANKIVRILNYMASILKSEPPEMDIKWGFVDLYLALSTLDEEYVLKGREADFLNFYTSFEQQRRAALSDPAALLEPGRSSWDRDLYSYIESFVRDGAKRDSIKKRHEVYLYGIHQTIPNLVPKDSKRNFSYDQRLIIWRRDNEICQGCGKQITFEEMHADHVIPHSKGGKTTVENGQSLCIDCNLKKGANLS